MSHQNNIYIFFKKLNSPNLMELKRIEHGTLMRSTHQGYKLTSPDQHLNGIIKITFRKIKQSIHSETRPLLGLSVSFKSHVNYGWIQFYFFGINICYIKSDSYF